MLFCDCEVKNHKEKDMTTKKGEQGGEILFSHHGITLWRYAAKVSGFTLK